MGSTRNIKCTINERRSVNEDVPDIRYYGRILVYDGVKVFVMNETLDLEKVRSCTTADVVIIINLKFISCRHLCQLQFFTGSPITIVIIAGVSQLQFFTGSLIIIVIIAGVSFGLLCVVLVIILASIVVVGRHMHGKCSYMQLPFYFQCSTCYTATAIKTLERNSIALMQVLSLVYVFRYRKRKKLAQAFDCYYKPSWDNLMTCV